MCWVLVKHTAHLLGSGPLQSKASTLCTCDNLKQASRLMPITVLYSSSLYSTAFLRMLIPALQTAGHKAASEVAKAAAPSGPSLPRMSSFEPSVASAYSTWASFSKDSMLPRPGCRSSSGRAVQGPDVQPFTRAVAGAFSVAAQGKCGLPASSVSGNLQQWPGLLHTPAHELKCQGGCRKLRQNFQIPTCTLRPCCCHASAAALTSASLREQKKTCRACTNSNLAGSKVCM